jgi:hypothetical protein
MCVSFEYAFILRLEKEKPKLHNIALESKNNTEYRGPYQRTISG